MINVMNFSKQTCVRINLELTELEFSQIQLALNIASKDTYNTKELNKELDRLWKKFYNFSKTLPKHEPDLDFLLPKPKF